MSDVLEIFVFNVGQGDNLLIKFSTGTWGLIDFYYDTDQSEPPSLTYLKSQSGKIEIDFLHISHYHYDHTKGMDKFFEWLEKNKSRVQLKSLWLPGMIPIEKFKSIFDGIKYSLSNISEIAKERKGFEIEDACYKFKYLDTIIEKYKRSNSLTFLIACQPYSINEKYSVLCLAPSMLSVDRILKAYISHMRRIFSLALGKRINVDENSLSTILFLGRMITDSSATMFAFGGDATKREWLKAIGVFEKNKYGFNNFFQSLFSGFIKVSHHGSVGSSDIKIWNAVIAPLKNDEVQIFISAGNGEHPHDETLQHILKAASSSNVNYSVHITGRDNQNYNYKYSDCFMPSLKGGANKRADNELYSPHSRAKVSKKSCFGYKYIFDAETNNAWVEKLT